MSSQKKYRGRNNLELVQYLRASGLIQSDEVFKMMCLVDRKKFLIDINRAYIDSPQHIGHGKTISAPSMHARTLEILTNRLIKGTKVLDVGSGSGYIATCMALALGDKGVVVAIECIPELRDKAKHILARNFPGLLKNERIKLIYGDGRLGYPKEGPYDVIHVGVAASEIPQTLIGQLAPNGRLLMPLAISEKHQILMQVDKLADGKIERKELFPVHYGFLTTVTDVNIENRYENYDVAKSILSENELHKNNNSKLTTEPMSGKIGCEDRINTIYKESNNRNGADLTNGNSIKKEAFEEIYEEQNFNTEGKTTISETTQVKTLSHHSTSTNIFNGENGSMSISHSSQVAKNGSENGVLSEHDSNQIQTEKGHPMVNGGTSNTELSTEIKDEIEASDEVDYSYEKEPLEDSNDDSQMQYINMEFEKKGKTLNESKGNFQKTNTNVEENESYCKKNGDFSDNEIDHNTQNEKITFKEETLLYETTAAPVISKCTLTNKLITEKNEDFEEENTSKNEEKYKIDHELEKSDHNTRFEKIERDAQVSKTEYQNDSQSSRVKTIFVNKMKIDTAPTAPESQLNTKQKNEFCLIQIEKMNLVIKELIETSSRKAKNDRNNEDEIQKEYCSTKITLKDRLNKIEGSLNQHLEKRKATNLEKNNANFAAICSDQNSKLLGEGHKQFEKLSKDRSHEKPYQYHENGTIKNIECKAMIYKNRPICADTSSEVASRKMESLSGNSLETNETLRNVQRTLKDQDRALIEMEKNNLKWNELQAELFQIMVQKIINLENKVLKGASSKSVVQKTILLHTNSALHDISKINIDLKHLSTKLSKIDEKLEKYRPSLNNFDQSNPANSDLNKTADSETKFDLKDFESDYQNDVLTKLNEKIQCLEAVSRNQSLHLNSLEKKLLEIEGLSRNRTNKDFKLVFENNNHYSILQSKLRDIAEKISNMEIKMKSLK